MDQKEQVSYKLLCNACLCVGQGLNLITDVKLKRFYVDALNEIPVCSMADITPVLCWDCKALLRRALQFKEQVKNSYETLLAYSTENLNCITDMAHSPRLVVKNNDTITISPDICVESENEAMEYVKNELKTDMDWNNRGLHKVTESLVVHPKKPQEVYLKDPKIEYNRDAPDSDTNADSYEPEVLVVHDQIRKRKKTKKAGKAKGIKERVKKAKTRIEVNKKSSVCKKILTIELSYEEMMAERDKESTKDAYIKSEYKCDTCIVGFNYQKSFKTHLTLKHSVNIGEYSCPVCKTYYASVDSFTAHYKRHMRRYECSICHKRTMDLKVMQQHYYSTHEISLKEYECGICGKISNSIDTHRYHRESHKARLQCPQCEKTFRHRAGLLNHRLSVHEYKNKFPCPVCNKVFKWRTSLRRHQVSHENKKPVAAAAYCTLCGVNFASLCSYQRHMANSLKHITKDQLRFICDHCNIKFADKTKLRDHIEEKHLHKTFQCHICMKTSKNRVGLDQHVRNVHKGRPNNKMCHHCGKGFPTKVQLESHIRTHTGERPFICEYCPTTFSQQSNLYKHNRQVHLNMKSKRYPACKKRIDEVTPQVNTNTIPAVSQPGMSVVLHYSAETGFLTAEL